MYLTGISQFPEKRSYAIMTMQGVYIPGDERSRTAPGHGYPERTEYYPQLQIFENENEWKEAISKLAESRFGAPKSFRAFIIDPIKVDIKVDVQVSRQTMKDMV